MPDLIAALGAFLQEHRRFDELPSKLGGATE